MRANPRTGSRTVLENVSRMHTAALFGAPLPRRIASRPVDWMAATKADGAAVPWIATTWVARSASTLVMPGRVG
jgi:hypothetical protein